MIKIWLKFLSNKGNLNRFLITILLFGVTSLLFSWFLIWVENRDSYFGYFNDPLFFWDPIDFSIPTFILTYGIITFYMIFHIRSPLKITYFIQMITFIVFCRIISLSLIQFDAPIPIELPNPNEWPTMIQLVDPILNNIIYHKGVNVDGYQIYTHHDLFFSGHTAKCLLASLLYENKKLKIFFIFLTCIMASFLVLQHVHYSIDVFFAPIVTFCAIFLHNKLIKSKQTL